MFAAPLTVLAPPACFGCGVHPPGGGPLCPECRAGLGWLGPEPVPLDAGEADGVARRRARPAGGTDGAALWAPLAYRGGAAALTRALKFRGALGLAPMMAAQIAANAPPGLLAGGALVPVPLHRARRRRRGFNQAERIAAALGAYTGLAVADVLRREGSRRTQMGRPRRERLRSLAGSVSVRPGAALPAAALVVDDVATTGATLRACAEALERVGCPVLGAVAYARTPSR